MFIARRFVALLLIALSVLLPIGSMPAMAMADHAGQVACPHVVQAGPADKASHQPVGLPSLPPCCYAMPNAATLVEATPPAVSALPDAPPRPHSDDMPASLALGPDLPPPRA